MVEVRLLGDVGVWWKGQWVDTGHTRQRAVLVALLVDPNRVVAVNELVERVWGDRPPQRARAVLQGYLSRLRRALDPVDRLRICRRHGGYLVEAEPSTVDVHRFRELVTRARLAADRRAVRLYEQALRLWRGDALATFDTDWCHTVRAGLHQERLAAQAGHADVALRLGRHGWLVPELDRLVAAHPLDERLTGQLMVALFRSGRQAEALARYRMTSRLLAEELGVDPGAGLREIHRGVLTGDLDLPQAARRPDRQRRTPVWRGTVSWQPGRASAEGPPPRR
ncbi:AfsR/SARP family transcriptional regulator [Micromonospora sp. KC721]|uniref:AfsR/SARP family transcriptional regulator n=1 Tax=Micromonospora sp. KC721 TaxID=2530380 RepID=UPI001404A0E9|nr:AfsR/SARP family transcriptional regulator [Micromonospora sp. KC721]